MAGVAERALVWVFDQHWTPESPEFTWHRSELEDACKALSLSVPKNLGDVVYQYRYRRILPAAIRAKAPAGRAYRIRGAGAATYRFILGPPAEVKPTPNLALTKIPDATPGVIKMYALGDEQALLARLRYNRLVDIFLQLTCYSLQNHLRTQVPQVGQVETDELYIGVDRKGAHYIVPVQAKGGSDILSAVQIEQDFDLCAHKFPDLECRAVAAQFMADEQIALFEFEADEDGFAVIARERHYQLVAPEDLSAAELATYRSRVDE